MPVPPDQQFVDVNVALAQIIARNRFNRLIPFMGLSTGDLPHAIPVLKRDPGVACLVFDGDSHGNAGVGPGLTKIANVLIDEFGIPAQQVFYVKLAGMTTYRAGGVVNAAVRATWTQGDRTALTLVHCSGSIAQYDAATLRDLGVDCFNQGVQGRQAEYERSIAIWQDLLQIQALDECSRSIVVVWGRKSGKRLGPDGMHPELDHSTTGMADLAARIKNRYLTVLAGDIAAPKLADAKHAAKFAGCTYIGEFWQTYPELAGRSRQIRFFTALRLVLPNNVTLVHVGMRSGSLDMYAMCGFAVVYIVANNRNDIAWNRGDGPDHRGLSSRTRIEDGRIQGLQSELAGRGMPYARAVVPVTPKAMKGATSMAKKAAAGVADDDADDRERGFDPASLDIIEAQIAGALGRYSTFVSQPL